MSRKLNREEFFYKVEDEGLDYLITNYLQPEDIEDAELSILVAQARKPLLAIQKILEDEGARLEEEEDL